MGPGDQVVLVQVRGCRCGEEKQVRHSWRREIAAAGAGSAPALSHPRLSTLPHCSTSPTGWWAGSGATPPPRTCGSWCEGRCAAAPACSWQVRLGALAGVVEGEGRPAELCTLPPCNAANHPLLKPLPPPAPCHPLPGDLHFMMRHSYRQYGPGQSPSLAPSELPTPAGAAAALPRSPDRTRRSMRHCPRPHHLLCTHPVLTTAAPYCAPEPSCRHLAPGRLAPGRLPARRLAHAEPAELSICHSHAWPAPQPVPLPAASVAGQPAGSQHQR